jgi:hypothetical protein
MITAMVVMEPGSDWPGRIGDSTHVVAFGHGADDLLLRTQRKIDAISRREAGIRVAILACSAATGGPTSDDRAELARTLLGAVRSTAHGKLILSASARASLELRRQLFSLAGSLSDELGGSSATVSLRFSEGSRRRLAAVDGR